MAGELLDWSAAPGSWATGGWVASSSPGSPAPSASTCSGLTCNAAGLAITNGQHDCGAEMASGVSCRVTCDAGYFVAGTEPPEELGELSFAEMVCTLGALDEKACARLNLVVNMLIHSPRTDRGCM